VDHSIVEAEPYSLQRLVDMLRKLRLETSTGQAYDATTLILATPSATRRARLLMDAVPEDLAPPQFFSALLNRVFERLPVSERATARQLHAREELPTTAP
jgi:hypothetical protein